MTWLEHGRIERGAIVLPKPLPLPEGAEVRVRIEPLSGEPPQSSAADTTEALPFFGMWSGREDMATGANWVRKERERWRKRNSRQR